MIRGNSVPVRGTSILNNKHKRTKKEHQNTEYSTFVVFFHTYLHFFFSRKLPSDQDQNLLPSVTWSQVTDIGSVVMDMCQKCMKKLGETYQHKVHVFHENAYLWSVQVIAKLFDFLVVCLKLIKNHNKDLNLYILNYSL